MKAKPAIKLGVLFGCVCLGLAALVGGVGHVAWLLAGAGQEAPEPEPGDVPDRHPTEAKGTHKLLRESAPRPRAYHEAPMLAERVKAGELPPVAERLPERPLVIIPPQQHGPYGGTWARLATSTPDIGVFEARLAYEGLVRWDPMGRTIVPNLAWKWQVEDDARAFTFHLRRGVRWSDGEPFTADDVLFWYQAVVSNTTLAPVFPRDLKRGGEPVEVVKLGKYKVRFTFKRPHGLFLKAMASGLGYVVCRYPAHYLKQFHADYAPAEGLEAKVREAKLDAWHQLFGNRAEWRNPDMPRLWPWVVVKPPPSRPVIFERNPYYWKVDDEGNQLPYIDRMTFAIFGPETINLKAINGELTMQGRHLQFQNYPLFMSNRKKGGYRVLHWINGGGGAYAVGLNLNHKDPVLKKLIGDKRFRKALSLAIDRQVINEIDYFGVGKPMQMAPPRSSPYYSAAYAQAYTRHDPDEANRLLDDMGLGERNRRGIRLRPDGQLLILRLDTPSLFGNARVFELIAHDWTAVGVKTDVRLLARQLFYTRKRALKHDCGLWWAADELVPVVDPRWFLPFSQESIQGIGYAAWFNSEGRQGEKPPPEIQQCLDLYQQIRRTADDGEQIRLFKRILELNRENLWVIGLIGDIPIPVIVSDKMRNVPEVAVYGWIFRSPGNTAPECYAIEQE